MVTATTNSDSKVCSKCKQRLCVSRFSADKRTRDKLQSQCRACHRKTAKVSAAKRAAERSGPNFGTNKYLDRYQRPRNCKEPERLALCRACNSELEIKGFVTNFFYCATCCVEVRDPKYQILELL